MKLSNALPGLRLFILLLVVGTANLATATTSPAPESIHKEELTHWNEQAQNDWHPYQDPKDIPVKPLGHQARFMTHDHGTRVIITITNFHPPDIETLLNTSSFRVAAINNLFAAVQFGAHGASS